MCTRGYSLVCILKPSDQDLKLESWNWSSRVNILAIFCGWLSGWTQFLEELPAFLSVFWTQYIFLPASIKSTHVPQGSLHS